MSKKKNKSKNLDNGSKKRFSFIDLFAEKVFSNKKNLALVGLVAFLLLVSYSIISYPKYEFFSQYLSDLGVGSSGAFFNTGIILCAVLLLPLMISIYEKFSFLRQTAFYLGVASMVFFACIAFFPLSAGIIHYYSAGLFFFVMCLFILFILIDFIKNTKADLFFTLLFYSLSIISIILIVALILIRTPFWQKLAVIAIFVWLSVFTLLIKK